MLAWWILILWNNHDLLFLISWETCLCKKHDALFYFGVETDIQNPGAKEKKYTCISPTILTARCKGLNSIILEEKWILFRWRVKGRNAILSEISTVIEILSHRGESVLYEVLSKNLFVGFKIQMPLDCQTYIIFQRKENPLEY